MSSLSSSTDTTYLYNKGVNTMKNILKLRVNINEDNPNEFTLGQIIEMAWAQHELTIKQWFISEFDNTILDFEGGIDSWFGTGMGSVSLYELGLKYSFQVHDEHRDIDLIIS